MSNQCCAQQEHTIQFDSITGSPNASLSDISWLEGYWRGEKWGGQIEEIWSEPLAESMMGSFKFVSDGEVSFYELCTISEIDSTLQFKIKHFSGELKGWEEKDDYELFRLIKVEETSIYFEGFTIEKIDDNHINMYVLISGEEGNTEEKFSYSRYKK